MSRFLLLGSATELGLRFLQAARSKLEIKCLHISEREGNFINRHQLVVNSLGGTSIPLQVDWQADSKSGHRLLKPLLKPILDEVDGVVFIRSDPSKGTRRFRYWDDVDYIVTSLLSESTSSPRILAWTKIPGVYRLPRIQETESFPSAQTKEFLEMVKNAKGANWTVLRSAHWHDDVHLPRFVQPGRPLFPKGGIAVGADFESGVWREDLASVMVEALQMGGLRGRTIDVKSVNPTKDNSDFKKVLAEVVASPKKEPEAEENVFIRTQ